MTSRAPRPGRPSSPGTWPQGATSTRPCWRGPLQCSARPSRKRLPHTSCAEGLWRPCVGYHLTTAPRTSAAPSTHECYARPRPGRKWPSLPRRSLCRGTGLARRPTRCRPQSPRPARAASRTALVTMRTSPRTAGSPSERQPCEGATGASAAALAPLVPTAIPPPSQRERQLWLTLSLVLHEDDALLEPLLQVLVQGVRCLVVDGLGCVVVPAVLEDGLEIGNEHLQATVERAGLDALLDRGHVHRVLNHRVVIWHLVGIHGCQERPRVSVLRHLLPRGAHERVEVRWRRVNVSLLPQSRTHDHVPRALGALG